MAILAVFLYKPLLFTEAYSEEKDSDLSREEPDSKSDFLPILTTSYAIFLEN